MWLSGLNHIGTPLSAGFISLSQSVTSDRAFSAAAPRPHKYECSCSSVSECIPQLFAQSASLRNQIILFEWGRRQKNPLRERSLPHDQTQNSSLFRCRQSSGCPWLLLAITCKRPVWRVVENFGRTRRRAQVFLRHARRQRRCHFWEPTGEPEDGRVSLTAARELPSGTFEWM